MATSQRKSVQIKISLTPKLYEDLRNVSEALGQAPATLAGLAVGQYVAQMGSSLGASQRAVETMVDRMAPEMSEQLKLMIAASEDPPAPKAKPKRLAK